MIPLIITVLFLAILFIVACILNYLPVILSRFRIRKLKQQLDSEIANFNFTPFVITNKLGEGSIMDVEPGTVTFEQAIQNQDIALMSVLELLESTF